MEIKSAEINDVAAIAELYVSNWKQTYRGLLPNSFLEKLSFEEAYKKWSHYLTEKDHCMFCAYDRSEFLGFAACKKDDELTDCLYLDSLHVKESARGNGIGTTLIKAVGRYGNEHQYRCMSICIVKGNDSAKRLYESLGAKHYKDFTDYFGSTASNSEKLLWENIRCFE